MAESVYSFFMLDDKARWRAFLWSWLFGTGVGTVAVFARASTQTLAVITLGVSFLGFGAFVAAYVYRVEKLTPLQDRRAFIDFAYAGLAAAIFVAVQRLFASPEAVHAAAVAAVGAVKTNQPLSPAYLTALDSKITALLDKGGQAQAMRRELVADYARTKAMIGFLERSKTERTPYPAPGSEPSSVLMFGPSQPGGTMFKATSGGIFSTLTFASDSTANTLLDCDRCGTIFVDVVVKNFSQRLDGIIWINVRFEKCLIEYDGGPLTLVDVLFIGCSFTIMNRVPASLRSTVTESGGPVTISSDYPA